jgi:general secretion pathway protein B
MSFILDALKKSEAERQRQNGPALLEMRVVRPQRRFPVWLVVVGAVLLLVNLAGLIWLLFRPAASSATKTTAAVSAPLSAADTYSAPTAPAATLAPLASPAIVSADPVDTEVAGDEDDVANAVPGRSTGALRNYTELAESLPQLRLDLHVYDATPARRHVLINMKKMREGESNSDGVKLVEITPDGVIMSYRGGEFLLKNE